jgi:hypothetical protein
MVIPMDAFFLFLKLYLESFAKGTEVTWSEDLGIPEKDKVEAKENG